MQIGKKEAIITMAVIILVIGYKQYAKNEEKKSLDIVEGLTFAANIKQNVTTYYSINGEFPNSNADIDLKVFNPSPGSSLSSVDIEKEGTIVVQYNANSEFKYQTIQLVPDSSNASYGIYWTCITTSKEISEASGQKCIHQY